MSSPVSSVNLSILSFALNSWLDGSAQLRRSLILFPLELGNAGRDNELARSTREGTGSSGESEPVRFLDRCTQWLTRPAKDLGEVEKAILGALDVSSSVLLLKLLGSGPILPFILNPLSITLALPRKLSIGSVKWSQVILLSFLLSALHEAQRTSVAAGLAWLRLKKAARDDASVGEVILKGEKVESTDGDEEEEPCVICSGGQSDVPLSDSISSIASLSAPQASTSDTGPLEAFCVHAPAKHPMHRACFLAWKDAYWEARASRPIITLLSDDAAVPLPGTWQWRRAHAILSSLGARISSMTYYVPLAPAQLSASAGVSGIGAWEHGLGLAAMSWLQIRGEDDLCTSSVWTAFTLFEGRGKYAFADAVRMVKIVEAAGEWPDDLYEDGYTGIIRCLSCVDDEDEEVSCSAYTPVTTSFIIAPALNDRFLHASHPR